MKKIFIIALRLAFFALILIASTLFAPNVHAQEGSNGLISTSPGGDTSGSEAALISSKFIERLNVLSAITLTDTVFTNPVFQSLSHFSQPIPDEKAGRANPFAPF